MEKPGKDVVLIGAGGHAKVIISAIRACGGQVTAALDDDAARWGQTVLGVPIRGPITWLRESKARQAVIAVGDNRARKRLAEGCIGAHVIVNTAATVDHDCRVENYCHLAPGTHLAGHVAVNEGAFMGIGAVAIPGKKIGAWSRVGAGAAVIDDVADGVTVAGVPARG